MFLHLLWGTTRFVATCVPRVAVYMSYCDHIIQKLSWPLVLAIQYWFGLKMRINKVKSEFKNETYTYFIIKISIHIQTDFEVNIKNWIIFIIFCANIPHWTLAALIWIVGKKQIDIHQLYFCSFLIIVNRFFIWLIMVSKTTEY